MQPNTTAPFVTAKQLNDFLGKEVVVAGQVLSADNSNLVLDGGDGDKIKVNRGSFAGLTIEPGMNVLIRGLVNPDLSVAESNAFPFTDMGEKFDMKLFKEATAITTHMNFAHIFGN